MRGRRSIITILAVGPTAMAADGDAVVVKHVDIATTSLSGRISSETGATPATGRLGQIPLQPVSASGTLTCVQGNAWITFHATFAPYSGSASRTASAW
jgi:hypothetical protein